MHTGLSLRIPFAGSFADVRSGQYGKCAGDPRKDIPYLERIAQEYSALS